MIYILKTKVWDSFVKIGTYPNLDDLVNSAVHFAETRRGKTPELRVETIETAIFDEQEIHKNCTVQILRNSVTGDQSIGWWEEDGDSDG